MRIYGFFNCVYDYSKVISRDKKIENSLFLGEKRIFVFILKTSWLITYDFRNRDIFVRVSVG